MLAVPQQVVGGQDFGIGDVEYGVDAAGMESSRARPDRATGRRQQRRVRADGVAAGERLRQPRRLHAESGGLGRVGVRGVQQHLEVARAQQLDDPAADERGRHDAHGAAVVADADRGAQPVAVGAAGAELVGPFPYLLPGGHDHAERVLGDRHVVGGRGGAHLDAPLPAGLGDMAPNAARRVHDGPQTERARARR